MKQLNPDQFQNLKEAYAQYQVDSMDLGDLMNLAWEYIVDSYKDYTQEELQEQIVEFHDQETLDTLSQDLDKI
jgi:hypothetical protein